MMYNVLCIGDNVMKALRYLLITLVVVLVSVSAQAQAQFTPVNSVKGCTTFGQEERQFQFNSTSSILSTDRSKGLAEGGAFAAGLNTGNPITITDKRRSADEGDTPPEDPQGPMENPIGDGTWALVLMAIAYAALVVYRRRKAVKA